MNLPNPLPVKALTFDAAGTLIRLAEPVGVTYARVAGRHGIAADPDGLTRAFSTVWMRTPTPFSSPAQPDSPSSLPTEKDWWRDLVREVFSEAASPVPEADFPEFFEELFAAFARPGVWLPRPGAIEALETLAPVVPCAILSNFDDRLRTILADLDILDCFAHVVLSAEVRAAKPDRRIFDHARALLDFPAAGILHVGDDPVRDGEGARDAGFRYLAVHPDEDHPLTEILEVSLASE